MDSEQRYGHVRRILLIVLMLNWLVAAAKIIFGLISRCSSMTADGFHSFSDGASNIIGLAGIFLACQPKDKFHPYGHKKYETLFSLGIAASLFIVCFELIKEAVRRLHNPVIPDIGFLSFAVMLATLGINIIVMNYERRKGRELKSDILISDSLHTRADILTSISVIFALLAIKLGFPLLDPIVTFFIALFIAYAAIDIIRGSSRVLCDTIVMDETKIIDIVLTVKGVKACHKIRTRGRPDDIHVDLHVQVNPDMHMDQAHKISYAIEEALKKEVPEITDVVVHMEPAT